MKITISKNTYTAPLVELIILDNDISLQLNSNPPAAPGEPDYVAKITPDYITDDPFKNNLG